MHTEGSQHVATDDSIERLRLILESEQNRSVEYEEARDIADSLFTLFEVLAEDINDGET